MGSKMKYPKPCVIIAVLTLLLLSLSYVAVRKTKIFPEGIGDNRVSYFEPSRQTPFSFQFSASALAEFEKYLGTPRRVFYGSKEQVLLHLKLTDKKLQYDLFFLDTKNEPCIIRSGDRYFRIPRSAEEIRAYIGKLQTALRGAADRF